MTQTMHNPHRKPVTLDPMDAAMNPERPATLDRTYFGEVAVLDAYFCTLEKGVGKRVFDETRDDPAKRSTAIKISVAVARQDGSEYMIDQDCTDFSKEWQKVTLPSLRKLNLTLKQLKGCFVQVRRTSTGETYLHKTSGEQRDRQGLEFLAVFPDRDAMKAAADLFYTPRSQRPATDAAPTADTTPAAAPVPTPVAAGDDTMRAYAAQTLPLLWNAAKQDKTAFLAMIASNPMISAHFNAGSEEVCALTGDMPF